MMIQIVPLNTVKDGGMFCVGFERNLCVIPVTAMMVLPDPGL